MRQTPLFVLVAVACAVGGYAIAHARSDTAPGNTIVAPVAGQPVDVSPIQPSFVGQPVKLYFRGSDDLPFPEMSSSKPGEVQLAMKVTYFSGTVKQVRGGWIELMPSDPANRDEKWVPTQSVAFVIADDARPPATRP